MTCLLSGFVRQAPEPPRETPTGATLLASAKGAAAASASSASPELRFTAAAGARRPPRKPSTKDFWSEETPAFLVGPGTPFAGKADNGLGPGAMFGSIDGGDDCAGMTQLERRLYHSETMPGAARATRGTSSRGGASPSTTRATAAPATPARGGLQASRSAPSLGGGRAAAAPSTTAPGRMSRQPANNPLPYPASEVGSEASAWKREFVRDAPPGLFARGLLGNDLSRAHAQSPGVCVLRQMELPQIPNVEDSELQERLDHLNGLMRRTEEHEAKRKAAAAKPQSPGGSSQGAPGEVMPKHQRMTAGRPSLCRPLPADLASSDKRGRYAMAKDSLSTSEYRSNMWWKSCDENQKREIKQFVRPLDGWTRFRDNAVKCGGALRSRINTY